MQRNSSLEVLPGDPGYVPPPLDSHDNILLFLNQIVRAQFAGKIELAESKFILQLVNTALRVIREKEKKATEAAKNAAEDKSTVRVVNETVNPKVSVKPAGIPAIAGPEPKPPLPAPAYKGDRIYDPYGCMPKV